MGSRQDRRDSLQGASRGGIHSSQQHPEGHHQRHFGSSGIHDTGRQTAGSILEMKALSKTTVNWLEVGEEADGQRIDNYLLRLCKGVPKSHVYRILRSGEVRVNKGRVGADYRLQAGDQLRLPPLRLAQPERAAEAESGAIPAREFVIIHEDEALLVLDKPAGVAVHGGSGVSFGVIEQLRRQRPEARMLELAHRLDRETSGLLIVAKKRSALKKLHDAFRAGQVHKRYLALVRGRWLTARQDVRLPLLKYLSGEDERRVRVADEGKAAHSIVRLVARWQHYSLVEVELRTGRTHQIRVHLAHLGFPIVGDDKYGDFTLNKALMKQGLKRMFLHAAQLRFRHPLAEADSTAASPGAHASGEPASVSTVAPSLALLALQASLPAELAAFVAQLDRQESREHG